jgi:hypothetical protein
VSGNLDNFALRGIEVTALHCFSPFQPVDLGLNRRGFSTISERFVG